MSERITLPLSRAELATAEIGLAHGRSPEEIAALGWGNLASIMQQRRALILQDERRAEVDYA